MRSCTDLSVLIRMIKGYRMRWIWHVAGMGKKIYAYKFVMEKPNGRSLFRRRKYGRGIRLKWILRA